MRASMLTTLVAVNAFETYGHSIYSAVTSRTFVWLIVYKHTGCHILKNVFEPMLTSSNRCYWRKRAQMKRTDAWNVRTLIFRNILCLAAARSSNVMVRFCCDFQGTLGLNGPCSWIKTRHVALALTEFKVRYWKFWNCSYLRDYND